MAGQLLGWDRPPTDNRAPNERSVSGSRAGYNVNPAIAIVSDIILDIKTLR